MQHPLAETLLLATHSCVGVLRVYNINVCNGAGAGAATVHLNGDVRPNGAEKKPRDGSKVCYDDDDGEDINTSHTHKHIQWRPTWFH